MTTDFNSLFASGLQHQQAGRWPEAEEAFRAVLEAAPNFAPAWRQLGRLALQQGQAELAPQLFSTAALCNPGDASLRVEWADSLFKLERYQDAELILRQAAKAFPADAAIPRLLALTLMFEGKFDDAIAHGQKAIELAPAWAETYNALGCVLETSQRAEEAAAAYGRAIELAPEQYPPRMNLARLLLDTGKFDSAIEQLLKVVLLSPESMGTREMLFAAYMRKGDVQAACRLAEEPAMLRSRRTAAMALRAAALQQQERYAELSALMDYDRLLSVRRISPPREYSGESEFNKALATWVRSHPTLQESPKTKATKRGKQTESLHAGDEGPFALLERQIWAAVEEYIHGLPEGSEHPFVAAKPGGFRLSIWATVLGEGGHQEAHIHRFGWLSGVYYVVVPKNMEAGNAGWIEFGRPSSELPATTKPRVRLIKPEEGLLILFPSFYFHRTIPVKGDEERISVAFDVVPEG